MVAMGARWDERLDRLGRVLSKRPSKGKAAR